MIRLWKYRELCAWLLIVGFVLGLVIWAAWHDAHRVCVASHVETVTRCIDGNSFYCRAYAQPRAETICDRWESP